MKFSLPWSGAGIRLDARNSATEAARRAGASFADWLNAAILPQTPQDDAPAIAGQARPIDPGPGAYAPRREHKAGEQSAPPAPAPALEFDRALAEIAARQQELNAAAAERTDFAPAAERPASLQNLSGLEAQLRKITDQIETLRKPGVEEAIIALRDELAEISAVVEGAMPRHALEAVEYDILTLAARIADAKEAGIDPRAFAGIEVTLAELKSSLYDLTPAESLIGYGEAITNLAQRIDLIVAENDPATMSQLETAVHTLRDMIGHVASHDIVARIAADVQTLSDKVERLNRLGTMGDVLWNLEQRIDTLSDALRQRDHDGDGVAPRLDALFASLADKIDRVHAATTENVAIGHLEDRIVQLMERLDASDSRLGHLEAIERGLADLLVHIEEMRSWRQQEAAQEATAVDSLRDDIARTQDALGAMQSTLGLVVDRLATIEHEIHAERDAPLPVKDETLELINSISAQALRSVSAQAAQPSMPMPARKRVAAAAALSAEELAANQPLEPGSGPPLLANPALRIASEATDAATATASGRSSFIAAARRAAQAAAQETDPRRGAPFNPETTSAAPPSPAMRRAKSFAIAASIVALVVGAAQIGGSLLGLDGAKFARKSAQLIDDSKTAAKTDPAPAQAKPGVAAPVSPPVTLADKTIAPPRDFGLGLSPLAVNPDLMKPQATVAPPPAPPAGDITGSIPQAKPDADQLPASIGGLWLRQAALAGDPAAAYEVGTRFAEGRGVPVNLEEAAHWFERAANKDLAPAQFRYASQLEKGLGVKKDLIAARKLYLAAAAKGNAKAMHNLAVLYAEGIDGKPDFAAALKWFQKAADHGVADSQYNLGILYARGIGVDANLGEAYKWFALAAAQGDAEAGKKRDEVATRLDATTLAAARQAVANFKAAPQPAAAITVPAPAGGWDKAAAAATAAPRVAAAFTMAK